MFGLLAVALALTPEELDDRLRSVENLDVDPELYRRVETPLTLKEGNFEVTLTSGVMVPIFSGYFRGKWENEGDELLRKLRKQDSQATLPDPEQRGNRELVGFVWMRGEGTVKVEMPHRSDALVFANRQVRLGGAPIEEMEPIAQKKAGLVTSATEGVFLSTDPIIDALFLGDPEGDPYEVVVYEGDDSLDGARRLLRQRHRLWAASGMTWANRIARDRIAGVLGDPVAPALLVDVHTDTRYWAVSRLPDGSQDSWLALVRDDLGISDLRWGRRVMTAGFSPKGAPLFQRISGVPFEPIVADDPDAQRLPAHRFEPRKAVSQTFIEFAESGLDLAVQHRVKIAFEAHRPTSFVTIALPKVESVPDTFQIEAVLANDVPLTTIQQTRRKDAEITQKKRVIINDDLDREYEVPDASRVRLAFPERLEDGDRITVELRWRDTWPYANWAAMCNVERPAGKGTGVQRFLPYVEGNTTGGPWTYTATVGVPEKSKLVAAVSGVTAERRVEGGWRLVTTELTQKARWPEISVGKYHYQHDPPQKGMPGVEAHLLQAFPGQLEGLAPEARRVVSYLQGWLPAYPVMELDVVEAPASCGGFVWKAPHGMAELQRAWSADGTGGAPGKETPKLVHSVYAHEIAHQYWGQLAQPASLDDRWMVESFAEVYSCMYVAAAFSKPEHCVKRMKLKRREVFELTDKRWSLSLSEAFHQPNKNAIVYQYGPYVMERMLRPRIGNEAFFGAIDVMLREHGRSGITNERLKHYFERASGKDLSDFWSFWVDQGLIPKVAVETATASGTVSGTATADVPFGTFDFEVEISEGERAERVWVTVTDGEGTFTHDGGWRKPKVVVDPDGRTLMKH